MSDLNEQLAPCPFCGSEARVECRYGVDYWVQCTNMSCASTNGKTTTCRDYAVTAWNRRAPAAAPAPVAAITDGHPLATALGNLIEVAERCDSWESFPEKALQDARAALAAVPAAAPVVQPVAWIRFRSDGGYEGPIMDAAMEDVRKSSGAWTPLVAASCTAEAKDAARYRFLRHADLDAMCAAYWPNSEVPEGEEFDKAVDAAIASSADEVKP